MAQISSVSGLAAPATVAQIELSDPVTVTHISVADFGPDSNSRPVGEFWPDGEYSMAPALVLVRLHGQPIGTVLVDAPGGRVDESTCFKVAWTSLEAEISRHLAADGLPFEAQVPARPGGQAPQCQQQAVPIPDPAPSVTVLVATRERQVLLASCLDALSELDYPNYDVVVVDNAPATDLTERLIADKYPDVRYVREDQPGLAAAHNCGLRAATGSILAFTDDDVRVDRQWLTETVRAFQAGPDVACVTGLILPAELQTRAQIMLEAHGQFGKGYQQRIFDLKQNRPDDPLFPFTAGQARLGREHVVRRRDAAGHGGLRPGHRDGHGRARRRRPGRLLRRHSGRSQPGLPARRDGVAPPSARPGIAVQSGLWLRGRPGRLSGQRPGRASVDAGAGPLPGAEPPCPTPSGRTHRAALT